ncbi:MAG TPA: YciI family protein [Puia sp.]|nr:YciI family protein [Puia sp.]
MKEFLLILKTEGSVWTDLSPEQLQQHLVHGGAYISELIQQGKLKSANPTDKGSRVVSGLGGNLKDGPFNESKEVVAGYFIIAASNIDEAVNVAKANPIFNDIPTRIEVHPLMDIKSPQ